MTGHRRCSHCSNNGHNSRTCHEGKCCLKLFGVKFVAEELHHLRDDGHNHFKKDRSDAMKRSLSMRNLARDHHSNHRHITMPNNNFENNIDDNVHHHEEDHNLGEDRHHGDDGYLSDELTQYSSCKPTGLRPRKKGMPWTEEEHRTFLVGLKKLGRGDWIGISKNSVPSRTPTQVASHAQKYFMRQLPGKDIRKKRRMNLFDLPLLEKSSTTTSPPISPSPFGSPPTNGDNCMQGSSDSSEKAHTEISPNALAMEKPVMQPLLLTDLRASAIPTHQGLPPLSPDHALHTLPYMPSSHELDFPRIEICNANDNLMKLSLLTTATPSPRQTDDTT